MDSDRVSVVDAHRWHDEEVELELISPHLSSSPSSSASTSSISLSPRNGLFRKCVRLTRVVVVKARSTPRGRAAIVAVSRLTLLFPDVAKQASQITMYDVKSYYNQAKNMVLNVPEMEAKVREATNEDAW